MNKANRLLLLVRQAIRPAFAGLIATTLFLVSAATPSLADNPLEVTAQDVISRMVHNSITMPEQWRVSAKAYLNGMRIGSGVLGWSPGLNVTLSLNSPLLQELGNIGMAFRPSGFVLAKSAQNEKVDATLVPYSELIHLLPLVFNREFLNEAMLLSMGEPRLLGSIDIHGRSAYILETRSNADTFRATLHASFNRLFADPELADFVSNYLGITPDMLQSFGDELTAQFMQMPSVATETVTRTYVDMQDYVILGVDQENWQRQWRTQLEAMGMATAESFPVPEFVVGNIITDDTGHLKSYTYSMSIALPAAFLKAVESAGNRDSDAAADANTAADVGAGNTEFAISVTMERTQSYWLAKEINGTFRIDLRGIDVPTSEPDMEPVLDYNIKLTLDWDLTKGADPKLLENFKLVQAEENWATAQQKMQEGDLAGAIAPLERLVNIIPNFIPALEPLANAYYTSGLAAQAAATFEKLWQLEPENLDYLNMVAFTYVEYGLDPAKGLLLATQARDMAGDNVWPSVLDTLAWAYYINDMLVEAEETALQAVEMGLQNEDEELGYYYFHLGVIFFQQEKYDAAREALVEAIKWQSEMAEEAAALINQIDQKQPGRQ